MPNRSNAGSFDGSPAASLAPATEAAKATVRSVACVANHDLHTSVISCTVTPVAVRTHAVPTERFLPENRGDNGGTQLHGDSISVDGASPGLRNHDRGAPPLACKAPDLDPYMMSGQPLMSNGRQRMFQASVAQAETPVGARVRVLCRADGTALRAHFGALTSNDLRLRFCHVVTPAGLDQYLSQVDCEGTVSFGVFDGTAALIGTAQLAVNGDLAEIGLSVLEQQRCRGIGTALVEYAADYARCQGARVMSLHCFADNIPIIRLAQRVGMAVIFDRGEADAFVFLGSLVRPAVPRAFGVVDARAAGHCGVPDQVFENNSIAPAGEPASGKLRVGGTSPEGGHRPESHMQTMELRVYQRPSMLVRLLESLVMSQHWVSAGACRVTSHSELPLRLQTLARKAEANCGAWRAWVSFDGVRLFTSEMCMDVARQYGHPALRVVYFCDRGRLQGYGLWLRGAGGEWRRCAARSESNVCLQLQAATAG